MLGLKFEEEEESGRAARLSKSLQKNKTVLVILDDIWEELSLENIGIPHGDAHRGCKVLLTSRKQGVLSRKMGTQKNFRVQHLCEEEAWSLFKKTAGDSVEQLKSIAIKVLGECDGLPVAIVTVAKALKGESDEAVWNNALLELENSAAINMEDVHEKVYSCLELSYNHLKGDEVKRLFLLCGMLGYGDISLDQLLNYVMGLDLFEHVSSLEQIRNKLVTLVKILKDSSLLLDAEDNRYRYAHEWPGVFFGYNDENKFVKMHDVVGDVARAIAAKDPHRFVVIKEALGLEELQRKEEFRNCSRISLQCGDLRELPERLVCSKLEFFLLNGNGPSLRIPNTFFQETELLKVLDLSATHLTPLPSSLGFLSNLRTLRVYRYTLQDMALIGELKKLQVLSFAFCEIERLPKEFMQLTDLRALDLSDCSHLEVIPQNVISSLSRLEHLCLAKSFTKWGAEGFGSGESNNACLSELNNLSNLKTLCIEIRDPNLLSKDLVFEKLTRYAISVSELEYYLYNRSPRRLELRGVNKPRLLDCFSKLFKTVEDLVLAGLEDTKHVLNEFDTDDFLQLKRLVISCCPGIQYIVDSTKGVPSHSALPILEELEIYDLKNMDAVCYGPIPEGSFGKLRSLEVSGCTRLKSFISLPMEQGRDGWVLPEMGSLDSTRDFSSTGSSATQELSRSDVPTPFFNEQVTLPSLKDLTMFNLDNVIAMWHNQLPLESCCNLKRLFISECNKLLNGE
ncbi:disease resistance protein At4g27190-like [Vitis riparia]|uniref:disease resistance protein At4g27190-like n=1 Tax=Vitis riparia TaxID=96939 RepID=UPI00155AC462|nr:disease resistance protein At4g27190-like [Vitis riparia]